MNKWRGNCVSNKKRDNSMEVVAGVVAFAILFIMFVVLPSRIHRGGNDE